MTTDPNDPFWIDWDYDRGSSTLGGGRYRTYVRQGDRSFEDILRDDPSASFAAVAWSIATGPVMVPPLVRRHPRISSVTVYPSGWNGRLIANITVVTPRAQALNDIQPADGYYFREQHLDAWGGYEDVGEQDLEHGAYLISQSSLLWQIPAGKIPTIAEVPIDPDKRYSAAVACVEALVDELNRQLKPVIAALGD